MMYNKLSAELMENNLDQNHLARNLDICVSSICDRLSGKVAWSDGEKFKVLELIHEPYDLLNEYFPAETNCERMQVSA